MPMILVIEDDPNLCLLYATQLAEDGFEVETAATGQEALAALERRVPDLVVLDIKMEPMDGLEILGEIRLRCRDSPSSSTRPIPPSRPTSPPGGRMPTWSSRRIRASCGGR